MAKRVYRRPRHERPPTLHGAYIMHWLMRGRRWTTSQWAKHLGLTPQGMLRILNLMESEHEYVVTQDEDRRWVLLHHGEPIETKETTT